MTVGNLPRKTQNKTLTYSNLPTENPVGSPPLGCDIVFGAFASVRNGRYIGAPARCTRSKRAIRER